MDLWFPTWLRVSSQAVAQVSNTASERSIFSGRASTITRSGDYMRYRISLANASDRASNAEKAKMRSLISALRGPANRIWYSPADYVQRGSFPSQELLTNNTFANGTTGWSTSSTAYWSVSVSDRRYRVTRIARQADGAGVNIIFQTSPVTTTAYAAYCVRAYVRNLIGNTYTNIGDSGVGDITEYTAVKAGLISSGYTVASTSLNFTMSSIAVASNGESAGDAVEIEFASVARCMLVDNSPNLLTYSDQFDNAAWTSVGLSATGANVAVAADGTTTADSLVENSSASNHGKYRSITVSSSADDYCITVEAKASTRTKIQLRMDELTGSSQCTCIFDLSAGSYGTVSTGANWANGRAAITSLGNGWYRCHLIARKTNAATSVQGVWFMADSSGSISYTGDGASLLYVRRGGLAQSSVPFIPAQTTTTASTGTSQTSNTINVKGLPVSTNGLLLEGDLVQIGKQIIPVVSSLNSDAAGCGTLVLAYPPIIAPADNDPVIVNTPMGYFKAANNENGYSCSPGGFSDFELELEEALA